MNRVARPSFSVCPGLLTPLLIFLNVLGFTGSTEAEPSDNVVWRNNPENQKEGDEGGSKPLITFSLTADGDRE